MPEPSGIVDQALRTLRATRFYRQDLEVDDELVECWLDTARWCGSSKNSQPWRFAVVRDQAKLEALSSCGDYADHLPRSSVTVVLGMIDYPYPFSAAFDLGRVAQSMMTNAHADGVGSCIAVFEPEHVARVKELLGFPERGSCNVAIGFGYPEGSVPEFSVGGYGRRPLGDVVGYERFPESD